MIQIIEYLAGFQVTAGNTLVDFQTSHACLITIV